MEEIKKKNKKLKKVAIILFIVIILLGALDGFLYFKMYPIIDYAMMLPSKAEMQMFNAQFIEFYGIQNGSDIKSLLQSVISNNMLHNYTEYIITIDTKEGSLENNETITNYMYNIETENTYQVNMYDSDNNGFIDRIFIKTEGEETTAEELELEKNQITYDKWLEEQKELEERHKKEENNKKITIIVISILAIIGLILIIKGLIILKKGDENKKRKVLISFITTERIITGVLLLVLLSIITGFIY